ncbi:MAG: sensor hybrid histidine kinase [Verrucomicrobiaceae bacterium]|nr:sensor hybrid histidine kinase [Verrucomicrobiaceae bacterium]
MTHSRTLIPLWQRYGAAILCVALMATLRIVVFEGMGSRLMYVMFYPAVMFAALYGGLGPGIVATLLSAIGANFLWGESFKGDLFNYHPGPGVIIFTVNGTMISLIIESLHRARHRLVLHQQELESQVENRTADLANANNRLKAEIQQREKAATKMMQALKELQNVKSAVDDHAVIAVVDKKGVILKVNDNLCALSKYSREELVGRDYRMLNWEPASEEHSSAVWETVEAGKVWKGDVKVQAKDGGYFWVEMTLFGYGSDEGHPPKYVVIWSDISERKRAEQALRESEARYRAIGESLDYGVWICDADGRNTYASDSFLNLVGMTQEQCSNFGWSDILHPDDVEGTVAAWKECVRTGGLWDREHRVRGVDGGWHYVLARGVTVRDDEGNLCGWAGINLDIGRLKETERALHESEAHLRRVLDTMFVFVGVLEPDGTLLEINRAVLEVSGIAPEEVVGKKFWECIWWSHSAEVQEQMKQAVTRAQAGDATRFDVAGLVAGGQLLNIDFTLAPMRDSEGKVVYLIPSAVDITERKEAEQVILKLITELEDRVAQRTQELHLANEELREQFAVRRRFEEEILTITKRAQERIAQDLHDDLGQQLAGLWCLVRVLEKSLVAQQSPEAVNAARISELLEKSLSTTRSLAQGLLPVTPEPQGLMSALLGLATQVSEIFHIKCQFECAEPVLVEDNNKATHLYRIAQESLSNAVKHGGAKNATIELSADETALTLSVWNDGILLPSIGTIADGMGLRIMRYRVGILGGTLQIQNHEGGGVVVTCTIPLLAPEIFVEVSHAD